MNAIVKCTFVLNTQILLTHHKSLLEKILRVHKKNLTLGLFFRLSTANATLQAPHNKHQTFTGSVPRGLVMSSMPSYTLWAVCRNKSGPCEAPVILPTCRAAGGKVTAAKLPCCPATRWKAALGADRYSGPNMTARTLTALGATPNTEFTKLTALRQVK